MKRYGKNFWITLFIKQNKWHKYSVLVHTLKVTYHLIEQKQYHMILAGLLHDIGKPYSAHQDPEDIITGEYSFTNHEAIGYHIIKNWPISNKTKLFVRYHYLIRGMMTAKDRGQMSKYYRRKRIWDSLTDVEQKELTIFWKCDDLGKQPRQKKDN